MCHQANKCVETSCKVSVLSCDNILHEPTVKLLNYCLTHFCISDSTDDDMPSSSSESSDSEKELSAYEKKRMKRIRENILVCDYLMGNVCCYYLTVEYFGVTQFS